MRKIFYNKEFLTKNKNEKYINITPNISKIPIKINTLNIDNNIINIKLNTERNKTLRKNNLEEFPLISTISNKLKKKKRFIKPLALTNSPSLINFYKSNENSHRKINKSIFDNISSSNRFRNLKLKDNIKTYLVTSLNRPKLLKSTLKTDSENAFYNSTESNTKKFSSKKLVTPFENNNINLKSNNIYKIKKKYTRRISFVKPISKKYLKKSSSFSSFDRMLEELDKVPQKNQNINYINKLIKKSLRNDINSSPWEEEDYIFYDKIENRINFFFDRILLPQLNNQLYFKNKIYDNFNELNEALIKSNFISKEIQMSLNRQRVKLILKNNDLYEKIKMKRILKSYEKNVYDETITEKFELEDFFIKKYTYNNVKIASKKERLSILKNTQRYSMTILNIDKDKIKQFIINKEINL